MSHDLPAPLTLSPFRIALLLFGVALLVLLAFASSIPIWGVSIGGGVAALCLVSALLPWWATPLAVLTPHALAVGIIMFSLLLQHPLGMMLWWCLAAHGFVLMVIVGTVFISGEARRLVFIIPALGIGASAALLGDLVLLRLSPSLLIVVFVLMAAQACALSRFLWQHWDWVHAGLFWSLIGLVILAGNQRAVLGMQSDLFALQHMLKQGETPLALVVKAPLAAPYEWGNTQALNHLHWVASVSREQVPALRRQCRELMALESVVNNGSLRITFDVVGDDHAIPFVVRLAQKAMERESTSVPSGLRLLQLLADLPDVENNIELTIINYIESVHQGSPMTTHLIAQAPAMLQQLDERSQAVRHMGITQAPFIQITRRASITGKPTILFRSQTPQAATALLASFNH